MNIKSKLPRPLLYALPALAVACYLPTVANDAMTYRHVVTEQRGCCGYVSENWIVRPLTYLLVDEWTQPIWTENAIKSERWLTSDGIISGETKFWRVLQREPISSDER